MQSILNGIDKIIFHFDGNNNDPDDISALPMAAAIAKSAGLQSKTTFFYGNNLSEPNNPPMVQAMRDSAAFAEKLGIDTYSYQDGIDQTTNELVKILNSGQKVLAIEGGPMEAIYRALERTSPANRANLILVSHSSWNEDRAVGSKPGGGKPRTWSDIRADFSEVTQIDIKDQNGSSNTGFNNPAWNWLDSTNNPVLKEARAKMRNAGGNKANDPSDAGMLFYAITGEEAADPADAKAFFDQNPPTFANQPPTPSPPPNPNPNPTPNPTPNGDPVYLGEKGDIVLEAENTSLKGNWKNTKVQGKDAVLYDGPNSFGKVPSGQTLSYAFATDESGQYGISLRSARDKSAMGEFRNDLGNDAFIAVEEVATGKTIQAPTKLFTSFGGANNELRWGTTFDKNDKKSPAQVALKANTQYRLLVSGRSDGYVIDRITLSNGGFLKDANAPLSKVKGSTPAPTPTPTPTPTPGPSPAPTPSPSDSLVKFSLVNAETDKVVEGYEDLDANSTINLRGLGLKNYSVMAKVGSGAAQSVKFESSLGDRIENVKPYALFGDNAGDFAGKAAKVGDYSVKAIAYSSKDGKGNKIATTNLNYTFTNTKPTPTPGPNQITFALVNADTNQVVKGFEDLGTNGTVNLNDLNLTKYNLIAKVAGAVKSVKFESGSLGSRVENVKPYALFGDVDGKYFGRNVSKGTYSVKATAFAKPGAVGNAIATSTLKLSIMDQPTTDSTPIAKLAKSNSMASSNLGMVGLTNADNTSSAGKIKVVTIGASDSQSQKLVGDAGDNVMVGVDVGISLPGQGERDILVGKQGADTFVLGNAAGTFYDDGDINKAGRKDFALIRDFSRQQGDVIQLHGQARNYTLGTLSSQGTKAAVGIFAETLGEPELVGVINNGSELTLESLAFQFV